MREVGEVKYRQGEQVDEAKKKEIRRAGKKKHRGKTWGKKVERNEK